MNKRTTYLFIFMLAMFFSKEALAGTDVLCNVLTTCNTVLKEVGEVQNKISGVTRKITSFKLSPESLLSSFGAGDLLGSAERLKEQAENLKEKAERVKEFAENAKEKKDELMAKYNELNQLATEKFAQAQEAIDKGKAIYEEYQGKYNNIAEKYETVKGAIEGGIDKGKELFEVQEAEVSEVAQENMAKPVDAQMVNSLASGKVPSSLKDGAQTTQFTPIDTIKTPVEQINDTAPTTQVNQADTISSAAKMVDKTIMENQAVINAPKVDILEKSEVKVTTKDVMKNLSNAKSQPVSLQEELKSDVSIKDQLTGNANRTLDLKKEIKQDKAVLSGRVKAVGINETRAKFGEAKKENGPVLSKPEIKANMKNVELKATKANVAKAASRVSDLTKIQKTQIGKEITKEKINVR